MKKTHHTFLLIFALASTLLVAGIYAYMQYVVKVSIERAATARDIVALERANTDREEDVRALHERTIADRRVLAKFLIPEDRVVEFIESIEALGPQTGSEVTLSISQVPPAVEGGYGIARAGVQAIGSWTSVMRALSLAENLPYSVTVTGVRVDASSDGKSKSPIWKAVFVVDVLTSEASSTSAKKQ